ncbi:MAG: crotonase/enoyl-CoA hydratase family protein [bacterium]
MDNVIVEKKGPVVLILINRPHVRNAVDRTTAEELAEAFREFQQDDTMLAAVLGGTGGHFCAGADLKAFSRGEGNRLSPEGDGPMGPSRMFLSKPVVAAVAGHAVAGGLELALMCDLRVAERDAVFGVFCRRWGVPLIDGGTVRLPRLIGLSRALDMILTGRPVGAQEALQMGLVNRVVENGKALEEAYLLARQISSFPQVCLRNDRLSTYQGMDLSFSEAMQNEFALGMQTIQSGESLKGAARFAMGEGRHGTFHQGSESPPTEPLSLPENE